VFSGEATNTNFIVYGLTRSWLEHTIYHSRGELTNNYTTDAIQWSKAKWQKDSQWSTQHYTKNKRF